MIKDRDDESMATFRFTPDKLRRYCRIALKSQTGASQQKIHQETEAVSKYYSTLGAYPTFLFPAINFLSRLILSQYFL